ncbi:MAG: hypothetical protein ACHP6I_03175, partial [Rickettsiales bacterium]
ISNIDKQYITLTASDSTNKYHDSVIAIMDKTGIKFRSPLSAETAKDLEEIKKQMRVQAKVNQSAKVTDDQAKQYWRLENDMYIPPKETKEQQESIVADINKGSSSSLSQVAAASRVSDIGMIGR